MGWNERMHKLERTGSDCEATLHVHVPKQNFKLEPALPGQYKSNDIFYGFNNKFTTRREAYDGWQALGNEKEGQSIFEYINPVKDAITGEYKYSVKLSRLDGGAFPLFFKLICGPLCKPQKAYGVTAEGKEVTFIVEENTLTLLLLGEITTELTITLENNAIFKDDIDFEKKKESYHSIVGVMFRFMALISDRYIESVSLQENYDPFLSSLPELNITLNFFLNLFGSVVPEMLIQAIEYVDVKIYAVDITYRYESSLFIREIEKTGMGAASTIRIALHPLHNHLSGMYALPFNAGVAVRPEDLINKIFTYELTTNDAKLIKQSNSPYVTLPKPQIAKNFRVFIHGKGFYISGIENATLTSLQEILLNLMILNGTDNLNAGVNLKYHYISISAIARPNIVDNNTSDIRHITDDEMIDQYPNTGKIERPNPFVLILRNTGGATAYDNLEPSTTEIQLLSNEWVKIENRNKRVYLPDSVTKNPQYSVIDYPSYMWVKSPLTEKIEVSEVPKENPETVNYRLTMWPGDSDAPENPVEKDLTEYQSYWGLRGVSDEVAHSTSVANYDTLERISAYWADTLKYNIKHNVHFRGDPCIPIGGILHVDLEDRKEVPCLVVSNRFEMSQDGMSGELEVWEKYKEV